MSTHLRQAMNHARAASIPAIVASSPRKLQRKCACSAAAGATGRCEACDERSRLHDGALHGSRDDGIPPLASEVLRSPGEALDASTRRFFERRFSHDFGNVRIHADQRAAESARALGANAWTVGEDIAFAASRYDPASASGRRLLAHELTHVVQQSRAPGPLAGERELEAEADRAESAVAEAGGPAPTLSVSGRNLLRQGGSGTRPQPAAVAPVAPNRTQQGDIEAARAAAAIRTQTALLRLRGLVPPGPSGATDPADLMRMRARGLAQVMFEWVNPNMDQIEEVVSDMVSRLTNPQVMVAGRSDPECGNRAAYVRGLRPPMVLCPTFFRSTPEERTRTMIHEAAHLARIGSAALGESYCVLFDCQTSCGGFDSADSWAQFVHCLSGRTPDQPTVIQGRPGGQAPSGPRGGRR